MACSCVSSGCRANGPSSGGGVASKAVKSASAPRAGVNSGSPMAGTAVKPSRPPRRITNTKRRPVGEPLPAKLSVAAGSAAAIERAARTKRRREVSRLISSPLSAALELGGHQQQHQRLRPIGRALDLACTVLAEQGAEAVAGDTACVDAAADALGHPRGPFDALPYRIGAQPLVGTVGPAGRRGRGLYALPQLRNAGVSAPTREGLVAEAQHAGGGDDELFGRLQLDGRCGPR